jgi:hypothetical protein
MATTLWPIIHRLAGLRALKTELEAALGSNEAPSKIAVLRTEFESTTQAIESALLQWQPQLPPGFIPDDVNVDDPSTDLTSSDSEQHPAIPTIAVAGATTSNDTTIPPASPAPSACRSPSQPQHARIASIYHNALAYRHASLVYLYRTVLGQARTAAPVQSHSRLALAHCVATVDHRGPMSALLWPLFVAACEAVLPADRRLAERAFVEVDRRQGMRNIDRAWGIVREVWRRADAAAAAGAAAEADVGVGVGVGVESEGGISLVAREGDGQVDGEVVVEGGEELWRTVCREMGVSIVFG